MTRDPLNDRGGGPAIRLAIVDDHEVFRLGLRALLERAPGIEVAWDTGSAHEAWRKIVEQPVDAILVDVNLGGPVDGLEATRMLTARDPNLRVVLMSGDQQIAEYLERNAAKERARVARPPRLRVAS